MILVFFLFGSCLCRLRKKSFFLVDHQLCVLDGGYLELKLQFVFLLWPKTQDGKEFHCKKTKRLVLPSWKPLRKCLKRWQRNQKTTLGKRAGKQPALWKVFYNA